MGVVAGAVLVCTALPADAADGEPGRERFRTVVVDAGHGGEDYGARGRAGLREKDIALDIAERLAWQLREAGLEVVLTRTRDEFVPLEVRTSIANDAHGDLFVSIHANASKLPGVRGLETFFASMEASDAAAQALAEAENQAFDRGDMPAAVADPLVALLGDLLATEHLQESQEFARLVQHGIATKADRSRGVKQAPFVVLLGVQMPAALVEIGFVTNPSEEKRLASDAERDRLTREIAEAVTAFRDRYDARRGLVQQGGHSEAH